MKLTAKRKSANKPNKQKSFTKLATWLRQRTSNLDFGFKYYGAPIHCNKNADVINALNRRGNWLQRMTNHKFGAHFVGAETYYFAGNGSTKTSKTLVMIDIDCHKSGSLIGAESFAKYLRDTMFPNLFFETSTNGNGVHAYIVLDKDKLCPEVINGLLKRLQHKLVYELSESDFDVELVEIKGTCPVICWGEKRGEVSNYRSGQLAKIPRSLDRAEEIMSTTEIHCSELFRLPIAPATHDDFDLESSVHKETSVVQQNVGNKKAEGSITGLLFNDGEIAKLETHYQIIAKTLMNNHKLNTSSRVICTQEDVAIFLMLLRFFTKNMNSDGSLPYLRFKRSWQTLIDSGSIERAFDCRRFAAMRNYLSSLGLIDWASQAFSFGTEVVDGERVKGKAARWKASELLMSILNADKHGQCVVDDCFNLNKEEDKNTSLLVTTIQSIIQSITPISLKDILRPILGPEQPVYLLSPDEISPHIASFESQLAIAA